MKKTIVLIALLIFFSCKAQKDFVNLKIPSSKIGTKITCKMFKDYHKELYGSEHFSEFRYILGDSAYFYFTNGDITSNYDNIVANGFEYWKTKIENNFDREYGSSGKNLNGLFWKEKTVGHYSYGYLNVPKDLKGKFDSIFSSVRMDFKLLLEDRISK
jgi:hypothetical protein